ncbi:MAG: methyltransferase domain-containing protein [Acidobacteriota bacterium]
MGKSSVEQAVKDRYSAGAKEREAALCCPVDFDASLLEVIPQEVVERDYGCGDPTKHVRKGETVLDLGSGSGKACFMLSQVVGPEGAVIGVDMTDDMLALARQHQADIAAKIGHDNVIFKKGKIQDLLLDRERLDAWLKEHPVQGEADLEQLEAEMERLRNEHPMIADDSIDVIVSNCVLNLVDPAAKAALFDEIARVLKPGGRAVISDIVCDEEVPQELQDDPELWSGCISGAFQEADFLDAFAEVGLTGVRILERQPDVWQVVEGIEFRSLTVEATKCAEGAGRDLGQAVVYKGPFAMVEDDEGQVLLRGERMAIGDTTFAKYSGAPYSEHVELISPPELPARDDAPEFPEGGEPLIRDPQESKGAGAVESAGSDCCAPAPEPETKSGGCC